MPKGANVFAALFICIGLLGVQIRCGGGGGGSTTPSQTAPTITTQPQDQTVTAPATATFTIAANGNPTPTYVWKLGGTPIPGATSATYICPATTMSMSGWSYTCTVTNSAGSVTSNAATLTVNAPTAALSGTAASGSPITGLVNVKDALGHSASATIDATGHYNLDVAGMTPPFILWAQGSANGHTVTIYSTAATAGTIDITPITNLILASALGATPEAAYAAWNGTQVSTAQVSAAKVLVQAALAPLLSGAGVAQGTDLMTASFSTDHTGLDAALDALTIGYTNGMATITNSATGSTYTENLANPSAATGLPSTDAVATQTFVTDLQGISAVWTSILSLWSTSVPTDQQLQTAIGPLIATGFMAYGGSGSKWISDISGADLSGFTISVTLNSPLTVAGFPRAYATTVTFLRAGIPVSIQPMQMVLGTGGWQMYGNQLWIKANETSALQTMAVDSSGNATFQTGFHFYLADVNNYAHSQGVQSAIINGPGMNNLVLSLNFPDTQFEMPGGGDDYVVTDDAVIQSVPDNAAYTIGLYSQASSTVTTADTPLESFSVHIAKAPLLNSALNAALFPVLTAPTGHSIASANIPGTVTLTWTNPAAAAVDNAEVDWNVPPNYYSYSAFPPSPGTSATVDTTGYTGPVPTTANIAMAEFYLSGEDALGRHFSETWALK